MQPTPLSTRQGLACPLSLRERVAEGRVRVVETAWSLRRPPDVPHGEIPFGFAQGRLSTRFARSG